MKTLLRGGTVLTLDHDDRVLVGERALEIRSQLCAAEMLLSGTTACVDNMHPSGLANELISAQLRGYLDAGLRVCAAPMIWNRPFTQTLPFLGAMLPPAERER